jgi:hypothetical protein
LRGWIPQCAGRRPPRRGIAQWRALDPDQFPFLHHVVDEFATQYDGEQFRAGLDLLLDGLRLQAGG